MIIVDVGTGPAVVLIPGIQGRWEWMRPAVEALARTCRVITFSLADEPTACSRFDEGSGFSCYVEQIAEAMDRVGVERAVICGISYGGLIAGAFAARHPGRVSGLVLTSAIPPTWTPDARVRFYLRAPVLLSPVFVLASVRLYREIAAASTGIGQSLTMAVGHATTAIGHLFSPSRMARRVAMLRGLTLDRELAAVVAPTLVLTGEPRLDRVVPVAATREYLAMWPHAEAVTIDRTGHLGSITRPDEFARIVTRFAESASHQAGERRRIG